MCQASLLYCADIRFKEINYMNKNISKADKFTRTVFGIIMIGAFFVSWGKWITMLLGILFLISAVTGYCVTCELYKKLIGKCKECKTPNIKSKQ